MYRVSGIDLRVAEGDKFPGDLRVDAFLDGRWVPLKMELALFLVDFFTENEDARRPFMPYWRQNGARYFLTKCISAVKFGWRVPAREIEEQRRRSA